MENQERLRSYVSPKTDSFEDTDDIAHRERIEEIEAAAIRYVLAYEHSKKRVAKDVNKGTRHNKGYDIVSGSATGDIDRLIEVKGVAGAWGGKGAMVTPSQFEFSQRHGEKSWLYVVEHATGTSPRLHRIQNFAGRVWRFGFDDGWEAVEEVTGSEMICTLPEPTVGLRVCLADSRSGVVEHVQGAGRLLGVRVCLTSGERVRARWLPDKVSLEGEKETS